MDKDEIKNKIEEEGKQRYPIDETYTDIGKARQYDKRAAFNNGCSFVLSLRDEEVKRLKAENEGHKEIARARGEAINELQSENATLRKQACGGWGLVLKEIDSALSLFPDDETPYERGLYDGYINCKKLIKKSESPCPHESEIEELKKQVERWKGYFESAQGRIHEQSCTISSFEDAIKSRNILQEENEKRVRELEEGLKLMVDQFNPDASDEKDVLDNPTSYEYGDVSRARIIVNIYGNYIPINPK